ncbi:pentatricopeptide repeat-containing protein At4g39952, mitochondrial [Olea europaea var. sylvestris]|uniref:pentatricopeptide repeat-containing protein At4g39952, mitochondrial n=1 Tax=Olea europaea var. sylvestris TaxID=158386 RepID=UPI000C1D3AA7|nr:pentatricopeptide repeat-containing protein At4g39952, mitochondrial [Olea europaea var. sylvestris]XP_022892788.1 pentatricopeptide repeat-containing protein At4g39952, mitochondrial [Olea europaea var. sylvestris]XP_022892789.1 pentatricopeptide repeat-containing protein At4g39952, mitochondrial [Olea europaea var. sylvestris]XP_022892791.1 pentatricopeptide repeat-containing protein At4g39952, mitochondrial [Olea europaea var. sylvestris]XP_022892792.1 pentatricopeptide repeat-containing 
MCTIKFTHLYKRFFYSSSTVNIASNYLHNHINSFLSNRVLDFNTLLQIHAYTITTGNTNNIFIASKLIAHYASLNQPHSSAKIFDSLSFKDPFLWNSVIKAHFSNGRYAEALDFFSEMWFCDKLPNQFTIPIVVSACAEVGLLCFGMSIHGLITKLNIFCGNSAVGSSFVYMYSKCGSMEDAAGVFDEITMKDVVAWTALVIGYVQNGESEKAMECLSEMHRIGGNSERPNFRTLEGGFQACGNLGALVEGRCLHGLAVKSGIVSSHIVQSSILSMYSKCETVKDAHLLFEEIVVKDLYSWTAIIDVYAKLGYVYECFNMFFKMKADGIHPDGVVISCLLLSFPSSKKLYEGKAFHGFILRRYYEVDKIVYNALLSMYCNFGVLAPAEKLFNGGCDQDENSWNTMIVAYGKAGLEMKSINLFREMQHLGIKVDLNSLISVISSCSKLETNKFGRSLHCHIIKHSVCEIVSVVNALIIMYGKCGNLTIARRLFYRTNKDIATWNSLISSYVHNGHSSEALALFNKMVSEGIKPNNTTLLILLSACGQIASVKKGKEIHDYIREEGFEYNIAVATALIDMYAKCGQLKIAREIFDSMNEKDVISWNVMISSYGMHGDGKSAMEIFQQMEQSNTRPNDLTFLAALSACAHAGFVEEGKSLFRKIKEYSVRPTLKHYTCMVDLLGRSGRLAEAEAFALSMPISPDGGIWGALLTACKMHNNTEMGIRTAKNAIEADPDNDGYYITISDLYSSVGMWAEVEKVRQIMKKRGVRKRAGWSTI